MGCTTVSSREFMGKMELAGLMESEGDISDGDNFEPRWGTKKKGNPKRLSKKERRRNTRLKKL
jgi:hypothetical protein